ncbi:uncharacterized protein NEMAJ01_1770 [Nematocida major]|uniref:uncharacterized protein n=1 Tax=Nematocida major TaxID=1912982 RepID=UPI00200802E1|nr:uncharacterized protein NEMAJ01_1770 [Nematocida major]KAH9386874.1 hypothetical protein NEMAJ01_1770 [Nematocida major]
MEGFLSVRELVMNGYKSITQQKLKRYTFRLSHMQRFIFYTWVSLAALIGIFLIAVFTDPVTQLVINHENCSAKECRYPFTIRKPTVHATYLYGIVSGAAQTHMKYATHEIPDVHIEEEQGAPDKMPSECAPYMESGQWVYPCGILTSTYPSDTYKILAENSAEVPIEADFMSQLESWKNPSSFFSGKYMVGKISNLPPGKYTLVLLKNEKHPLPDRSTVIVRNAGAFGTMFSNAGTGMICAAVGLAVVNCISCFFYV